MYGSNPVPGPLFWKEILHEPIAISLPASVPLTFPHIGIETMSVLLSKTTPTCTLLCIYLSLELKDCASQPHISASNLTFPSLLDHSQWHRNILYFIQFYENKQLPWPHMANYPSHFSDLLWDKTNQESFKLSASNSCLPFSHISIPSWIFSTTF